MAEVCLEGQTSLVQAVSTPLVAVLATWPFSQACLDGLAVSGRQQWLRYQSLGYEQAHVQTAGTATAVVLGAPGQLM